MVQHIATGRSTRPETPTKSYGSVWSPEFARDAARENLKACCTSQGCDSTASNGLEHVEAFEFRMPQVEGLVLPGATMGGTKLLRLCPSRETAAIRPARVRRVERVIVALGAAQQMEFHEAWYGIEVSLA